MAAESFVKLNKYIAGISELAAFARQLIFKGFHHYWEQSKYSENSIWGRLVAIWPSQIAFAVFVTYHKIPKIKTASIHLFAG